MSILSDLSSTIVSLGYTTKIVKGPNLKEFDTTPIVMISPVKLPVVQWHGFGNRNIKEEFEVVYVAGNQLDANVPAAVQTFKETMVKNFMGPLAWSTGIWQSRVTDAAFFRRDLLPKGYDYSPLLIRVDFIVP